MVLFGGPSPWGWQVDGHDAVINHMVVSDQMVIASDFLNSEAAARPVLHLQNL